MSLREIGVGPFKGNLVEDYEGNNEFKTGTAFVPALGIRVNTKTGEPMPGTALYGASGSDFERNQMRARMQQLEEQLAEAEGNSGASDQDRSKLEDTLAKQEADLKAKDAEHKKELEELRAQHRAAIEEREKEHKEALAKVSSPANKPVGGANA